jgi:hypothetical protein
MPKASVLPTGRRLDEDVPTGEHVLEHEPLDGKGADSTALQGAADGAGTPSSAKDCLDVLLPTALAGACGSEALG